MMRNLMKKLLPMIIFLLLCCGSAMAQTDLISCEFRVFGGMENENISYTVKREDARHEIILTVEDNGKRHDYTLPGNTLDDLADFMAGYQPKQWENLPDREFFALDAPSKVLKLIYEDGNEYTVTGEKETDGPLFRELDCFLQSYLAKDAQTFELSFSSFGGGGPEFRAILTAPEKMWVETATKYDESFDLLPPGSEYKVSMIFHGRIPGRTELSIDMSGPLVPVEDIPQTVYVLEVDDDYNVTLAERREE